MHAAESAHWYTEGGQCVEEVKRSKPKLDPYTNQMLTTRKSTLADARKLGLYPSWSTVKSVTRSRDLDRYKTRQLLDAAWRLREHQADEADWKNEVYLAAQQHGEEAANMGTAIHAQIERYVMTGEKPFDPNMERVAASILEWFGPDKPTAEVQRTNAQLAKAGKIDLYVPCQVIADIKTKDRLDTFRGCYESWGGQLAWYADVLGEDINAIRLVNIVVPRDGGTAIFCEWGKSEHATWTNADCHAYQETVWKLWKMVNRATGKQKKGVWEI